MTAIVCTYYNRQEQLLRTLESFTQYDPNEFRVVIVDDGSDEDIKLPITRFEVVVLKTYRKTWLQGDPAWNIGFYYALLKNPNVVILQNAECYHEGDILSYAKRVTDKTYISFGCYSQSKNGKTINNKCASFGGDSAWYNHPVYRPTGYHFCSAITANNLRKINGFDERFSFGVGYDDDYLLHQIKCLGLKVEITEEPFVIHQWHEQMMGKDYNGNEALFNELIKQNNYKAEHLLTIDL
jgi:glycosyltransferase involved in cell wall biosynthesis